MSSNLLYLTVERYSESSERLTPSGEGPAGTSGVGALVTGAVVAGAVVSGAVVAGAVVCAVVTAVVCAGSAPRSQARNAVSIKMHNAIAKILLNIYYVSSLV